MGRGSCGGAGGDARLSSIRIAAIQLAIEDGAHEQRPEPAFAAARAEAARGADVVVLPEPWPVGGFGFDELAEVAEPLDGTLGAELSSLAGELGIVLHGGQLPRA